MSDSQVPELINRDRGIPDRPCISSSLPSRRVLANATDRPLGRYWDDETVRIQ